MRMVYREKPPAAAIVSPEHAEALFELGWQPYPPSGWTAEYVTELLMLSSSQDLEAAASAPPKPRGRRKGNA